jgi:hypothetical protein
VTLPIIGGDYGTLKRLGLAARAETLELRRRVEAIERQLTGTRESVGTQYLYSIGASLGNIFESATVTAGKLIDGRDISVDGATLDGHTTSIASHTTSIAALGTAFAGEPPHFIAATAMFNRDAVASRVSNNQVGFDLSVASSGVSRFAGTWRVPDNFNAGSSLSFYVWHYVGTAGTNGQDVFYRFSSALIANGEATGTNGVTTDVTLDIPAAATPGIVMRSTISTSIASAAAGDLVTIHFDRRGGEAADTMTGIMSLIGFEPDYDIDYT